MWNQRRRRSSVGSISSSGTRDHRSAERGHVHA
jgi:hypothetical protein